MPSISNRYERELAGLSEAIEGQRHLNPALQSALSKIGRRSALYVGSGGALAAAHLAADLHRHRTNSSAEATTPLLSVQAPAINGASFVLFSSSGKNPDAAAAMAAARLRSSGPVVLITRRNEADLPARIRRHVPEVVTVPSPADGFLATGSIAAMTAAMIGARGHAVPPTKQLLDLPAPPTDLRPNILVLHGWGLQNVATDIETRLSELGLAAVQVADYRNFAHGRHVGYQRNADRTSIIALIDPGSRLIAERTLSELPPSAHVLSMESELEWPGSALQLLMHSMRLPLVLDERDPAKPKVPTFGRKLYNLPIARLLRSAPSDAVARKVAAGGQDRTVVADAFEKWNTDICAAKISAVVLDYDGTCCTTQGRFDPPEKTIQDELTRVLDMGLGLGFASGRGKSLPEALRSWLPREHWDDVIVGLYNGSVIQRLSEPTPDCSTVPPMLQLLADELLEELGSAIEIQARSTQLGVESSTGASGDELLPLVRSVLGRTQRPLKAFASGHSVDVISYDASKTAVVDALSGEADSVTLRVGDQGAIDGNDFELLAAAPTSLSVNTVSSDLTRCWNLDERGESGPDVLRRYLQALRSKRGNVMFDWKRAK